MEYKKVIEAKRGFIAKMTVFKYVQKFRREETQRLLNLLRQIWSHKLLMLMK